MKKIFNHATILIVATLFTFNACLLTDPYIPYVPIDNGETTSVLLSFNQETGLETRAVDWVGAWHLRLLTGDLYLVAPNGIIVEHFRIVDDNAYCTFGFVTGQGAVVEIPATAHTINRSYLVDGVRITGVPTSMRGGRVYLVGNPHVNNPTTGHIDNVRNQPIIDMRYQRSRCPSGTQQTPNSDGVHLFGYAELELVSGSTPETWAPAIYVCQCNHPTWCHNLQLNLNINPKPQRRLLVIRPIVARIAIQRLLAMGQIAYFTIDGVFIDNYYRLATVDGRPYTPSLRQNIVAGRPFNNENLSGYPNAFRGFTWEWHNPGVVSSRHDGFNNPFIVSIRRPDGTYHEATVSSAIPPRDDGVQRQWAFYVFANRTPGRTPHLVFRLRNVELLDGTQRPGPYYITFHDFVYCQAVLGVQPPAGTPFSGIHSGAQFTIPMNGLIFMEEDLQLAPSTATTLSTRAVPIMIEE